MRKMTIIRPLTCVLVLHKAVIHYIPECLREETLCESDGDLPPTETSIAGGDDDGHNYEDGQPVQRHKRYRKPKTRRVLGLDLKVRVSP